MFIGTEQIEIHLPGIRSLKEKRKYLNSLKDTLKKLNISVSEVKYQNLLQRSLLGISLVSGDKKFVEMIFQRIEMILRRYPELRFTINGVLIEKK